MCFGEFDEENPVSFERRIDYLMVHCNIKKITGNYQYNTVYNPFYMQICI